MAQAQHGSAPDIAGEDRANPTALLLSAGMLLGWLGRRHGRDVFGRAERALDAAVDALIRDPATRTRDLGGPLGTKAFAAAVCDRLHRAGGG
jgi:3-isopropylmalate dehydrogenase